MESEFDYDEKYICVNDANGVPLNYHNINDDIKETIQKNILNNIC